MDLQNWLQIGHQLLSAPDAKTGARVLIKSVPTSALSRVGLARAAGSLLGVPFVGAFVVGALSGAAAVLFLAPGGQKIRQQLLSTWNESKLGKAAASTFPSLSPPPSPSKPRRARSDASQSGRSATAKSPSPRKSARPPRSN